MQQVVVPQFLDVEDKIIGPVTVRQFIELIVGGLVEVIMYKTLDFPAFVVFGLIVLSLTVVVAFARINGQPFHLFLLNFIQLLALIELIYLFSVCISIYFLIVLSLINPIVSQ